MLSFDGAGYGRSIYWIWRAESIAREHGEVCSCWEANHPKVSIGHNDQGLTFKVECASKRTMCRDSFPLTETELHRRFKDFYRG